MKRIYCSALGILFVLPALSTSGASAQTGAETIAGHITAAKAAAGSTWLGLFSEMCGGATGAGGRASSIAPAPGSADAIRAALRSSEPGPPPREDWYRDPVKMFDNVYAFATDDLTATAITTSEGIILIDATNDYQVKDLVTGAMPKVGLDPAQIRYVVITHAHSDHLGGAKYLQDTYGARIVMSEADWAAATRPSGGGGPPLLAAERDIVATDGMELTLGDATITIYVTPGHTVGTISFIIPVKDKGVTHYAAMWGGTTVNGGSQPENVRAYTNSSRRMRDLAARAGADIILSPHGRVLDLQRRAAAARAFPTGPNPFIVGEAEVKNFFDMTDHCSQAISLAQAARTI